MESNKNQHLATMANLNKPHFLSGIIMKKQLNLILASFLATGMLLLTGCKESPSTTEQQVQTESKTTTVGINANLSNFNNSGQFASITGDILDIDNMDVTVRDASTDEIYQAKVPMSYSNGKWTALIEKVPTDKNLSFSVDAYELDSDSTSDFIKTYSGVTYKKLFGDASITVSLTSSQSESIITMPQLYSVQSAEKIVYDVSTDLNLIIRGRADTSMKYEIISPLAGGTFVDKAGTIKLNGNSATLIVNYVAPFSSLGTHLHKIRLTDSMNNQITTSFKTTVVLPEYVSTEMKAQFAPRIKYIQMQPDWLNDSSADNVDINFFIDDDNPINTSTGNLIFEKDSTGDSTYAHTGSCFATYCSGQLRSYESTTKGWLRFTVTDNDGLETSVSTYISENLFSGPVN